MEEGENSSKWQTASESASKSDLVTIAEEAEQSAGCLFVFCFLITHLDTEVGEIWQKRSMTGGLR